jgi:hypothetical protein
MRNRVSKVRGGALASTLLIILFLTIFALTLANLATFDLRTVNRNGQKQLAFEAAQAGLDAVTAELTKDPTVGQANEVFTETLSDGSSYRVSFDTGDTVPFSANNLDSLTPETIGYDGRSVPALHASLFSTGTSPSGETSIVECLIRLEAIPYAVAGTGTVRLRSMIVGPDDNANVYSGDTSPTGNPSMQLSGLTMNVAGDARSAGSIVGGGFVNGTVEEGITPETLPSLTIGDFDNTPKGPTTYGAGPHVAVIMNGGEHYVDSGGPGGTARFISLTLLNNATVYVEGNLEVTALTGIGTIFVNGNTDFLQAITVSGTNRLTLFSEGDINFALGAIMFQGVLYSHGNITSTLPLNVIGAVYAAEGLVPGGGNINIGGLLPSTVTYASESTAFASFWLAQNGEADAIRVYWRRLR